MNITMLAHIWQADKPKTIIDKYNGCQELHQSANQLRRTHLFKFININFKFTYPKYQYSKILPI